MKRLISITIVMILGLGSVWSDEWTQINPANSPDGRHGHTMVTLPDGRVMLFGGEGCQGDLKDDLFAYDANGWNIVVPANDPPPKRKEHQAWVMNSKMWVYGGYGENGALDDMWTYDIESNEWYEVVVGSRPPARSGHATIPQSDGSILILGGKDSAGNNLNDFWRYSCSSYQQLENCPKGYSDHIAHMIDDDLLFVFGEPGIIVYYQFSASMWDLMSGGPPLSGYSSSTVAQNDEGQNIIFIFGGHTANGDESDVVYEFNTVTGELTQRIELMPQPTANCACAQLDTELTYFKHSPLFWQTDTTTSPQYNISVLLFGGLSGGVPNNNTYSFIPISIPDIITLIAPLDSVTADSALFIWNHAMPIPASYYQVQVAGDPGMTNFFADTIVSDTSCILYNLSNNTDYWWRVRGYNAAGWGLYDTPAHFFVNYVVSIDENPEPNSKGFYLNNNYPNPFNDETTISFLIPKTGKVEISIYNIKGQKIKTLVNENLQKGHHEILWNGKNVNGEPVSSGIYFYKMETDNFSEIKKAILLK